MDTFVSINAFASIIVGHLWGDFVTQNKWMAVNKSASHFKCFVHCFLYTLFMCLFTWKWSIPWIGVIFGTHFIIDRWSLADKWLLFINGRALTDFLDHGHERFPNGLTCAQKGNYRILRGGFSGVVYTVVDNTFHLTIAWYLYKFLFL